MQNGGRFLYVFVTSESATIVTPHRHFLPNLLYSSHIQRHNMWAAQIKTTFSHIRSTHTAVISGKTISKQISNLLHMFFFKYSFNVSFLLCVFRVIVFSLFVHSCLFPNFVQVYRSLPPGGNPIAVNIISYIISYRIVSYHI